MGAERYIYKKELTPQDVAQGETSQAKILHMIKPYSTVLECGPAYGYMTQYMKENLHCKVYIIEISQDGYDNALRFAEGGVCANLENDDWLDYFEEGFFDYIIYADVLEHLHNPQKVMEKMRKYLKADGSVLLSVPNIANGDIIMNLLCDQFDYTPWGLLDETHIHFFARKNLQKMVENTGYHMAYESAIRQPICKTEQGTLLFSNGCVKNGHVQSRMDTKNIYQFVCQLTLTGEETTSDIDGDMNNEWAEALQDSTELLDLLLNHETAKEEYCNTQIFYDYGQGFNEEQSDHFVHFYGKKFRLEIPIRSGLRALRMDPADKNVIVTIHKFIAISKQGITDLEFTQNGIQVKNTLVFDTNDPQIVFSGLTEDIIELRIVMTVCHVTQDLVENYRQLICDYKTEQELYYEKLERQAEENTGLAQARDRLQYELEFLKAQSEKLLEESREQAQRQLSQAREQFQWQLDQTCNIIAQELTSRTAAFTEEMVRSKERSAQELAQVKEKAERELAQMKEETEQKCIQMSADYTKKIEGMKVSHSAAMAVLEQQRREQEVATIQLQQMLQERENLLDGIQKSLSFRLTRPLYKIKSAIYFGMGKFSLTRKLRKAVSILRRQGIHALFLQTKQYYANRKVRKEQRTLGSPVVDTGVLMYDAEYQENQDFSGMTTDVKAIAFYLPQFHTFPENDAWWGTGFTEWTNVRKGQMCFAGHYQPRVPHKNIGYYCLEDVNVLAQQAKLAKQHGIYGFCFYYYWFSGKRLMEKPVDLLLEHPEIDISFCFCWANENWTRRWDGAEEDILIRQEYRDVDDENFIRDMQKYLEDARYIRINGKPLIVVYNPWQMPNRRKSFLTWREVARELGIGEILIWTCQTWQQNAKTLDIEDVVDAEVEFPPHNVGGDAITIFDLPLNSDTAILYDYNKAVDCVVGQWYLGKSGKLPVHYSCMLAWDNAARRKEGWHAFYHFSLWDLHRWVTTAVKLSCARLKPEERIIFINAWNEWGEGTYLEPDEKYGYASINTVSKALYGIPFDTRSIVLGQDAPKIQKEIFQNEKEVRIAVQIHIYFTELLEEIGAQLDMIPFSYDLYITTDSEEKKVAIMAALKEKAHRIVTDVVPNRGRDVAPFLIQMQPVIRQYDYIGHFHTKKTETSNYGDEWRHDIFCNLFGNKEYMKRLFNLFESDKKLGLIMPEIFPPVHGQTRWSGEQNGVLNLLKRMGYKSDIVELLPFPTGGMFWARTDALHLVFDLKLNRKDFPKETGQRYGTIAHQLERAWPHIVLMSGYQYLLVKNGF